MDGIAGKTRSSKLTARFCEAVRPGDRIEEYHDGNSTLVLRVTPAGVKSWSMRYRTLGGKQKRHSLGRYDLTPLAMARELYTEAQLLIKRGGDPAAEKQKARIEAQASAATETVEDVGELYLKACEMGRHKKTVKRHKAAKSIAGERSSFRNYIVPHLGKFRLKDLNQAVIQEFINDIEDGETKGAARLAKKTLHSIYTFATWQGYVQFNPCAHVAYPQTNARLTTATPAQLRTIWEAFAPPIAVADVSVSPGVGYCIQLAMILAQRIGEVALMRISQLNFEENCWIMPKEITKNGREHAVPLPPLAIELIRRAIEARSDQDCDPVFPGHRDKSKSIRRGAPSHAFIRVKRQLRWGNIRLHDLRRTAASLMAAPPCKISQFIISKVLNHSSDFGGAAEVTAGYNVYAYFEEKSDALNRWEARLRAILSESETSSKAA